MSEFCTCGAKLVEGALFCHRCGRPVREPAPAEPDEPAAQEESAAAPAAPPAGKGPAPEPESVSFQGGTAVRVGFLVAVLVQLASTLSALAGASILMPLLLLGGGFYAAVLYMRRTGSPLTIIEGARVGWITGIFTFVIATVFFTAGMAALTASGDLGRAWEESLQKMNLSSEAIEKFRKMISDPKTFAFTLIAGLIFQFFFLTIFCSLGGMLGARLRSGRHLS
ncbi:MAG: hypothetical protein KatS3mg004_2304 [Bryobacteraceae bacterium]|nr:MAG: hypothetical protein KatS3mg004_2304 [Bryobacteraceae bacterium]